MEQLGLLAVIPIVPHQLLLNPFPQLLTSPTENYLRIKIIISPNSRKHTMGLRAKPIITDFSGLTMAEMLDVVQRAEARRQAQCRGSAISYLRRRAREAGMTIEEYTQTLDPRGTKRKYFPEGVVAPARRPTQKEVAERKKAEALQATAV